jgi:adenylate cyclase
MAKEIECKYLVDTSKLQLNKLRKVRYAYQMYISNDPNKVVRVVIIIHASDKHDSILEAKPDISKAKAKLTIKSGRNEHTRDEYEYKIPVKDALQIMSSNMTNNIIRKIRVHDKVSDWDIDFNMEPNMGLVLAEKEYESEEELKKATIPEWAAKNVSDDDRFYNVNLSQEEKSFESINDFESSNDNELKKIIWVDKEINDNLYQTIFDKKEWLDSMNDLLKNPPAEKDKKKEEKLPVVPVSVPVIEEPEKKKDKGNKLINIKFQIWKLKFKFSISLM